MDKQKSYEILKQLYSGRSAEGLTEKDVSYLASKGLIKIMPKKEYNELKKEIKDPIMSLDKDYRRSEKAYELNSNNAETLSDELDSLSHRIFSYVKNLGGDGLKQEKKELKNLNQKIKEEEKRMSEISKKRSPLNDMDTELSHYVKVGDVYIKPAENWKDYFKAEEKAAEEEEERHKKMRRRRQRRYHESLYHRRSFAMRSMTGFR